MTCSLSTFFVITFSTLKPVSHVFCNCFSQNVSTISSVLRSLITYVYGTVFFCFLIKKTNSNNQFGRSPSQKYFGILILLQDHQLWIQDQAPYSIYALNWALAGFIFIVLWSVSFNLLVYRFLIPQSYACKLFSSKFWWFSQQQHTFLHCVLSTFQFYFYATTTLLLFCKSHRFGLLISFLVYCKIYSISFGMH